jgi:hypothetical protein
MQKQEEQEAQQQSNLTNEEREEERQANERTGLYDVDTKYDSDSDTEYGNNYDDYGDNQEVIVEAEAAKS